MATIAAQAAYAAAMRAAGVNSGAAAGGFPPLPPSYPGCPQLPPPFPPAAAIPALLAPRLPPLPAMHSHTYGWGYEPHQDSYGWGYDPHRPYSQHPYQHQWYGAHPDQQYQQQAQHDLAWRQHEASKQVARGLGLQEAAA